ncbi:hypothetical protein ACHQM5_016262 [Ranunculus cassubicifolius]
MPHYGIHDELMDDWEKELQGAGDIVLSDEVDSYLIDRLEGNDKSARRFDILGWWKVREHEREKEEQRSSSVQSSGVVMI